MPQQAFMDLYIQENKVMCKKKKVCKTKIRKSTNSKIYYDYLQIT